jgi:ferredoxin
MAEATIFYFTGTGNSLKVAKDLASGLGGAELVQVAQRNRGLAGGTLHTGTVGFVFPVYYAGLPHMVEEFAQALRVAENTYVFAVATYGGMPGIAFRQLGEILSKKGIHLAAAFGVRMPGNNQVLYSPQPEKEQQEQFRNEREVIAKVARSVAAQEKVPVPPVNAVVRFICQLMYGRLKPQDRDRHFHPDEKCNGCGICARVCPADNITIEDKKPAWHHRCEYCLACMQWCPARAIQYDKKTVRRGRYHHPDINVKELFQR